MSRELVAIAVGLGLLIGLAVFPSEGDAKKCTGPGFTCNSPEGCEFTAQMMSKWGSRAIFRDDKLAAEARKQAEASLKKSHPTTWEQHVDTQAFMLLQNAAHEAAAKVQIKQCPGSTMKTPPGFEVKYDEYTSKCKMYGVVGAEKTQIKDTVKDPYNLVKDTCDEMIDASLVHEGHHMTNCNQKDTLDAARKEEAEGYTLEIHYLRDEMRYAGRRCTPSPKRRKGFVAALKKAALSAIQHQGAQP